MKNATHALGEDAVCYDCIPQPSLVFLGGKYQFVRYNVFYK
jgi:hypothetical protein